MKTRPGTQIVNNHKIFFGFGTCPVAPFAPVAELGSYGKAFISEHPKELLAKGQIKNVPWMVSYATSEGEFMTKGKYFNEVQQQIEPIFRVCQRLVIKINTFFEIHLFT